MDLNDKGAFWWNGDYRHNHTHYFVNETFEENEAAPFYLLARCDARTKFEVNFLSFFVVKNSFVKWLVTTDVNRPVSCVCYKEYIQPYEHNQAGLILFLLICALLIIFGSCCMFLVRMKKCKTKV